MKNEKQLDMKKYIKSITVLCFILLCSSAFTSAQDIEKVEKFRIKTVTTTNGVKTVLDTTFTTQEDLDKFMAEQNVPHYNNKTHKTLTEIDDEVVKGKNKKVVKIVEYKVSERCDSMKTEGDVEMEDIRMEIHKKIRKMEDMDVEMENIEEVEEYLNINDSTGDVNIIIIKRTFKISDLTKAEKKEAKIKPTTKAEPLQLMMSPNPANSTVQISIPKTDGQSHQTAKIQILDMTGKKIKSYKTELINSTADIDVAELVSGSYILQLSTDGQQAYKKLIIEQ